MLSAAGVSIEPGQVSEVPRESTSTTDPKNTITIPSETTVDDNKSQQASTCFFRAQKMPEWFCNPPKNHMLIFTPGYRLSQLPEAQIVLRLYLSTSPLSSVYFLPVGNFTRSHFGFGCLIIGSESVSTAMHLI